LLLLGAIEAGLRLAGYGFDTALFKKSPFGASNSMSTTTRSVSGFFHRN
jgi:hypothetical protein